MDTTTPLDTNATPDLNAALAKAQGQMGPALKDSNNPAFKSKFASLASVIEACRPLSDNGIAYTQHTSAQGRQVSVCTILRHASGQVLDCGVMTAGAKDESPQAIGSVVTYLRRYSLMAAVGLAADDDDGNAASGRGGGDDTWRDGQREQAPPRAAAKADPNHHASWASDQAPFCAALKSNFGLDYKTVADWLSAQGKKRPSAMTIEERQDIYKVIASFKGKLPAVGGAK